MQDSMSNLPMRGIVVIRFGGLALAGLLLLAACSASGSYTDISPLQLKEMLKQKNFALVNTHIPYEGEITPTDAFIAYDQTERRLGDYPADRSAKVVVYCRSGRMSEIAARVLVKQGYANVFNLAGGMIAWEKADFPLAHDSQRQ